jgi:hypothetical protein
MVLNKMDAKIRSNVFFGRHKFFADAIHFYFLVKTIYKIVQ